MREVDKRSKTHIQEMEADVCCYDRRRLGRDHELFGWCTRGESYDAASYNKPLPLREQMLMKLMRRLPLPITHPIQSTKH